MPKVATRVDLVDVLEALARPGDATDDLEERVLDVSGALLRAGGFDGLEVDRVAEGSGVGRSTIYRRFGGRNALIAATVAHEARRFLTALADAVEPNDDLEDQVVAAFTAGLEVARLTGVTDLVRAEPLLLRLLTVDAGPVVRAATDHLVALAVRRGAVVDPALAGGVAEVLVRLAISFVVTPATSLPLDEDPSTAVRRSIGPLLRATA